jgi:hypothetical protein
MSDQQKRGFRLPWAADRAPDEGAAAATMDPAALDPTAAAVSDDAENGHLSPAATATSAERTDAAPAASDVPEVNAEADMIDTESALRDRIGSVVGDDAWPSNAPTDAPDATARPAFKPAPPARIPRRDNPLVAGLVKAMREAAVASRAETTSRLQAEVTARVEAIRADATTEAAALRKRVDEDIAGIREWSKGEMARIRQETEERIEARRADAISENERHTDGVERLVQQVESTVTAYEADMDRFFERLLAEDDPGQLASLAEQAPEPPDLSGDMLIGTEEPEYEPEAQAETEAEAVAQAESQYGPEAQAETSAEATATDSAWGDVAWAGTSTETTDATMSGETADGDVSTETGETVEAVAETSETVETEAATGEAEATVTESSAEPTEAPEALEASAAAEAEDAASEGLDMSANDEWPAAVLAAARRNQPKAAASGETGHSRVFVNGLTSVAGISAFKGAVAQLPGIRSVSVSSGERGVFIFTVSHDPETDIAEAVTSLTTFGVQITEATADSLTVTAHEPAA